MGGSPKSRSRILDPGKSSAPWTQAGVGPFTFIYLLIIDLGRLQEGNLREMEGIHLERKIETCIVQF
jgi:hypothetical protein